MAEIALEPLVDGGSGTSFQGYATDLREDILDEATRNPAGRQMAYKLGVQLCDSLIAVGNERAVMIARLNNNLPTHAASGANVTKVHPELERPRAGTG